MSIVYAFQEIMIKFILTIFFDKIPKKTVARMII